jgi:homoserine dehydrogenase
LKNIIKVGIIGYGTIGMGTAKILIENKDLISKRTGKKIILEKIVDLDITTQREYQVNSSILSTDINDIINNKDIDIVVESIGGIIPAKTFIETALKNKKSVVTPNNTTTKNGPGSKQYQRNFRNSKWYHQLYTF